MKPGIYRMESAEYHASAGVSKSMLDWVHVCPALLEWSRKAPIDTEAAAAVDLGTAIHSLLLEPDKFHSLYVADFAPPDGTITTADGLKAALDKAGVPYKAALSKSHLAALLLAHDPNAPVSEALYDQWKAGVNGRTVLSPAEWRKLYLMRDSVMAHPTARKLIEMAGAVESSIFWRDRETAELCRARPDKVIDSLGVVVDLKSSADASERGFNQSIGQYRYHVQDSYYSEGCTRALWKPKDFLFIVIGSTRDRRRYPCHVRSLPDEQREMGRAAWRMDLATYAHCRTTGLWNGIESASLPSWLIEQGG